MSRDPSDSEESGGVMAVVNVVARMKVWPITGTGTFHTIDLRGRCRP